MATPLVAGLVALMKAADPALSNQCLTKDGLFATCDTMPDPDYRAGFMGAGRINAMKALAMSTRCFLTMTGNHLNDPNGNGVAEPGEACGLTVTIRNEAGWATATSVSATLTCTDADVTITKNTATFPNIPGGSSANCAADSFTFTVRTGASPPRRIPGHPTATPANLGVPATLSIQVGFPASYSSTTMPQLPLTAGIGRPATVCACSTTSTAPRPRARRAAIRFATIR